jgi:hypothetical protein
VVTRTLAVRLDNAGDVLVTGPALRALAADSEELHLLAGPNGTVAGRLLPGVDDVLTWRCPWIDPGPAPVDRAEVERLLGPFDVWKFCPHGADDGCTCRKPAPGMVKEACADLGVEPSRTVLVGDIGADVEAARAAGATGILVPTPRTRQQEVAAADRVRRSLTAVVDDLVEGRW